jgi:ribonuclease BN (tRNA processing enzyme)
VRVRFWGVRGTIPSPGPDTVKLGANTSCLDVLTSDQSVIILDAGTGIRRLGRVLSKEHPDRIVATMLITHTHWDHIQGFPFFGPLMGPQGRFNRFVVVGKRVVGQQLEEVLAGQIMEPYLPFLYKELTADIHVKEIKENDWTIIGDETSVYTAQLDHPGGCLGYRLENNGAVFAYCTDTSHKDGLNENVLRLAEEADLLVHDAHWSLEEREKFPDWGHSSWLEAAQVAVEAKVKCLALFHYAPDATDEVMEERLLRAREIFPNTILAREGMVVNLPLTSGQLPE